MRRSSTSWKSSGVKGLAGCFAEGMVLMVAHRGLAGAAAVGQEQDGVDVARAAQERGGQDPAEQAVGDAEDVAGPARGSEEALPEAGPRWRAGIR